MLNSFALDASRAVHTARDTPVVKGLSKVAEVTFTRARAIGRPLGLLTSLVIRNPLRTAAVAGTCFVAHRCRRGIVHLVHRPVAIPDAREKLYAARETVTDYVTPATTNAGSHKHADAARARAAATRAVEAYRARIHGVRYDISSSHRESAMEDTLQTNNNYSYVDYQKPFARDTYLRRVVTGIRCNGFDIKESWIAVLRHWTKGTVKTLPVRPLIVSCIDTAYYHPLKFFGFPATTIYVSYALNPKSAALVDSDGGFYHLTKGGVVQYVPGGGFYRHRAIDVTNTYASMALGLSTVHYDAVHAVYPGDRVLSVWVPNAISPLPRPILAIDPKLVAPPIDGALHIQQSGSFYSIDVVESGDMRRSICSSHSGGSWSMNFPISLLRTVQAMPELGLKLDVSKVGPVVRSIIKANEQDLYMFCLYARVASAERSTTYTFGMGACPTSTESLPTPLVTPAVSTTPEIENLKKAFELRFKPTAQTIPREYYGFRSEFVDIIKSGVGSLQPDSRADVEASFQRAAQTARADEQVNVDPERPMPKANAFCKLETSSGSLKPRQIISLSHTFNVQVLRFSKPLSKAMRKAFGPVMSDSGQLRNGFYCVGASPEEVSAQVAFGINQALGAQHEPADCDYSSFDGSVSMFQRAMLHDLTMSVFDRASQEDKDMLEHLLNEERKLRVKFVDGTSFVFRGQIVSGSGWTSLLGTLSNALNWYITCRSRGISKEGAMHFLSALCLFGDDGLASTKSIRMLSPVAKNLGMDVTSVVREGRVSFLARDYFFTPGGQIAGSAKSIVAMPRGLQKFCSALTTSTLPNRCASYATQTPLLGPLVAAATRFVGAVAPTIDQDRSLFYKASIGPYVEPVEGEEFRHQAYQCVADDLGLTVPELQAIETSISNTGSLQELKDLLALFEVGQRALPDGARWVV